MSLLVTFFGKRSRGRRWRCAWCDRIRFSRKRKANWPWYVCSRCWYLEDV